MRRCQELIDLFSTWPRCTTATAIIIEDSGPGLGEEIITRLGERFFRGSTSEFSTGSGLGWSIIKQIAREEKVNVLVESPSRFGGLKVEIIFS